MNRIYNKAALSLIILLNAVIYANAQSYNLELLRSKELTNHVWVAAHRGDTFLHPKAQFKR